MGFLKRSQKSGLDPDIERDILADIVDGKGKRNAQERARRRQNRRNQQRFIRRQRNKSKRGE